MTPKMESLLTWFADEIGPYDGRTLRIGQAMTAVALQKRGLMRSYLRGEQNVWSITPKGVEAAEQIRAERRAKRQAAV